MAQRCLLSNVLKGIKLIPATSHVTLLASCDNNDNKKNSLFEQDDHSLVLQSSPYSVGNLLAQVEQRYLPGNRSICAVFSEQIPGREDVYSFTIKQDDCDSRIGTLKSKRTFVEKLVQTDPIVVEQHSSDGAEKFDQYQAQFENQYGVQLAEGGMHVEAESLWRAAASHGSLDALFNLGVHLSKTPLGKPNYDEAAQLWSSAAEKGHSSSKYQLAVCHIRGLLTCSSPAYGSELMERSAEGGCVKAQLYMAIKLLRAKKYTEAEAFLRAAALDSTGRNELQRWLSMHSCPQVVKDLVTKSIV